MQLADVLFNNSPGKRQTLKRCLSRERQWRQSGEGGVSRNLPFWQQRLSTQRVFVLVSFVVQWTFFGELICWSVTIYEIHVHIKYMHMDIRLSPEVLGQWHHFDHVSLYAPPQWVWNNQNMTKVKTYNYFIQSVSIFTGSKVFRQLNDKKFHGKVWWWNLSFSICDWTSVSNIHNTY